MTSIIKVDTIQTSAGGTPTASSLGIGGVGKIGQVVSTEVTDITYSNSSTTPQQVTGLSVSITPSSTSSKILIIGKVMCGSTASARNFIQLRRGTTKIGNNASAGSRQEVIGVGTSNAVNDVCTINFNYLDSPNTTSATTYNIYGCCEGSNTFRLNRSQNDTDDASVSRGTSVITVMEVLV